jgi:hypothetical protein
VDSWNEWSPHLLLGLEICCFLCCSPGCCFLFPLELLETLMEARCSGFYQLFEFIELLRKQVKIAVGYFEAVVINPVMQRGDVVKLWKN